MPSCSPTTIAHASCAPNSAWPRPGCRSHSAGRCVGERWRRCREVSYLIFNEGYTRDLGDRWMRPELSNERCAWAHARRTDAAARRDPRTVALMEIQASRNAARTTSDGRPVLLAEQDRGRWIGFDPRGLAALARAQARAGPPGRISCSCDCRLSRSRVELRPD